MCRYEEAGKFLSKRNTFNDFVDVAGSLIESGWTEPARLTCEGRSAGGLLVGNAINQAPHLFKAFFEYMLSYSPVNQVQPQAYPSLLATTGLHDPRVAYWEPAKWVQHLRAKRTNAPADGRNVLLKTDMSAGHFSASDRYKYLKELAFDYAWLLQELGLRDDEAPGAAAAAVKK
ncbi:prolyl oligopeptidase family-domain-containing protein [Pavlovales sp. CCMP2436]|nr:prolyl oligopeptidase family-domain-containing protein [Pavlovales sp. CCMP2436]